MIEEIFRSLMFVPAHNDRLIESAIKSKADVLLLDVEDSVQPSENKALARKNIKELVSSGTADRYIICPRINDVESGHILDDLLELSLPGIWGFMYPKSQGQEDIFFIDKLLASIEAKKNLPKGSFNLLPLIETTSAVLNAREICQASNRVKGIAFGCEDFVTDLGGIHDPAGNSLFTARALIAIAAKSEGVVPIDTVHINVHDLTDLEQNLKLAKNLGFEGMLALHPKELDLVNRYFSPSKEEVQSAKELLKLADESYRNGKGVAVVGDKFIGPPMVAAAQKTLFRNELIERKKGKNTE